MRTFLYRLLRGVLFAVAGIAGAAVILTIDAPTVPNAVPAAAFVACAVAGSAFFWIGELPRAPLDKPKTRADDIPGAGRITGVYGFGSPDLEDVTVYPADGGHPLRLGTVSLFDYGRLCAAPDPLRLRVRASLIGGVR